MSQSHRTREDLVPAQWALVCVPMAYGHGMVFGQLWILLDPFGRSWSWHVMACHGMDVTGSTICCIQGSTPRCGHPLRHSAPHFDPRSPRPWRHDLAGAAHQGQQGSPWQRPRQLFDIEDIEDIDDISLGNTEILGTSWNNLKLILRIPLRSQDPSIPYPIPASCINVRPETSGSEGNFSSRRNRRAATWPWSHVTQCPTLALFSTCLPPLPDLCLPTSNHVFALSKCVFIIFSRYILELRFVILEFRFAEIIW